MVTTMAEAAPPKNLEGVKTGRNEQEENVSNLISIENHHQNSHRPVGPLQKIVLVLSSAVFVHSLFAARDF